jgi:O-antigen/teichoic acid export membrane protein
MLKDKLKKLKENNFIKNILITLSGGSLSMVIGLALMPVLGRLYTPEHFGALQFVLSTSMLLVLLGSLRYPFALVLPESKEKFIALLRLCIHLTFFSVLICFLVFFLGGESIFNLFNIKEENRSLAYLIPVFMLVSSFEVIFYNWNVREKAFKRNSVAMVGSQIVGSGSKILAALAFTGSSMLLIGGQFLQLFTKVLGYLKGNSVSDLLAEVNKERIKSIAKEYKSFPTLVLPGNFITRFSNELPIFVLAVYFDQHVVGLFAFSYRLVIGPTGVLVNSISPVFLQKSNELILNNEYKKLERLASQTFKTLSTTIVVPFAIIAAISDWLIPFIFGDRWVEAGVIFGAIVIAVYYKILYAPFAPVFRVLKKEHFTLFNSAMLFTFRLTGISIGIYLGNFQLAIILYCLFGAASFILASMIVFSQLKLSLLIPLRYAIFTISIFVIVIMTRHYFYPIDFNF